MAITATEAQAFALRSNGAHTDGLTVPGGAVALLVGIFWGGSGSPTDPTASGPTFGGLAMTLVVGPGGGSDQSRAAIYELLDISGRANDDLVYNLNDTSGVQATFLSCGGALVRDDTASDTGGPNVIDSIVPSTAAAFCYCVGTCASSSVVSNASINPYTGMSQFSELTLNPGAPSSIAGGAYHRALTTTTSVGVVIGSTASGEMVAACYSEVAVLIEPEPIGVEVGFFDGPLVEASGDRYVVLAPFGVEVGFFPGIRVDATGEMQVALVGTLKEVHRHTSGGTEGQVLTFHADDEPTWEDGTGGASVLDDLDDVDAPAPGDGEVLVWDEGEGVWRASVGAVGPIIMSEDITDPPEPVWTEDGTDYVYAEL